MARDLDAGSGDEDHFSAADLEKLYRKGGLDGIVRVQGRILNEILGTKKYQVDAMYLVTDRGVQKL
jgi:hypothetical protein